MIIKQFIFFIILSFSILLASDIEDLLLDIQENNKIDLSSYHLIEGWNSKDKVFLSLGFAIFDFNKATFIEDKRKYSMVAFIDAKASLSSFILEKLTATDEIDFSYKENKLTSNVKSSSNNIINNTFRIFQTENFDKQTNTYTIESYLIYCQNIKNLQIKSTLSLNQFISNLDLYNTFGSRYFIDKNNNHYLLNFSIYPIKKIWQDRLSAKKLAEKELTSMIKSSLKTKINLNISISKKSNYSYKQKENIDDINTKNIILNLQQVLKDKITNQKYFITICSYELKG